MAEPRQLPAVRPVYEAGAAERGEVDAVYLPSTLPNLADLEIIDRIADRAAKSAYIAGARTAERAAMLILAGRELRVGPWQALSGIHIIKDRPSISAHLMGALVQRFVREQRGGLFRAVEQTSERCTIEYRRPEWTESSFVTWTIEDARAANLVQPDSNWKKFPRQMLFSRATGEAARSGFPDVVQGLYTPEELEEVPWSPPAPVAGEATVREVPAATRTPAPAGTMSGPPAPDDATAVRQRAIQALHAFVGERYDGDPHTGVKLLQGHLYEGELAFASLTDEDAWPVEDLREFYRAMRDLPAADFAMIVTSEDGADEAEVEADGRTVDPETGEITDRASALIQWRELAASARTIEDWRGMFGEAAKDPDVWGIFVQAATSVPVLREIAKAAKAAGAQMPAIVGAIEMREAQLAKGRGTRAG